MDRNDTPAFGTVFRFAHIAVQATGTRLFMITMLIADQTVHAAGGKHSRIHFSVGIFMARLPCQLTVSFILPQFRERGNSVFSSGISNLSDIRDGRSKKCRLVLVHRWTSTSE